MAALPLVLVPGLNCTELLFGPQVARFGPERPVTVADHRQGETIEAIARQLLKEAPPRFALAGLSMGGYVALEVMRMAPGRVERLALIDTRASPDSPEDREIRNVTIRLAEIGRFDEIHAALWPRLVHLSRLRDEVLQSTVMAMAEATGPRVFIRQQKAVMSRRDFRPGLAAITCPTLVLVGDQDAVTPPFMAEDMAAAIPGARLETVPDCGHLSTLERPDVVNAALAAWLVA